MDEKHIADTFNKRDKNRAGPSFQDADRVQFEGVHLNANIVLPNPAVFGQNDAIGLMSEISLAYGQADDIEIAPTRIEGQYGFHVYNETTVSIERIFGEGQNQTILFISLTEPADQDKLRETLSAVLKGFSNHDTIGRRPIANLKQTESAHQAPSTPRNN